jgi:multidrug efflux pump subunit AcrB
MERLLWEVPGVEYLYSTSSPGAAMVVVRFYVGEDEEKALVRLNQKLAANMDRMPPGVSPPIVKPRAIDDVPILALTLWGARYDDHQLRQLAAQLNETIKEVPNVSEVTLLGGRPRQVRIDLEPARLAANDVDPLRIERALQATNVRSNSPGPVAGGQWTAVQSGARLTSVEAVRQTVVAERDGRAVLVSDVADVADGDAAPSSYVRFHSREGAFPAVTIAVAKRKGTNAITVATAVERKLDTLRGTRLAT